mmetsp:Transcript_30795/g.103743  ORF Transcript_30795/g.103743 Transcript_30795/m.103743 type:complete len:344 (-) Transcript_30795:619-1650(-)
MWSASEATLHCKTSATSDSNAFRNPEPSSTGGHGQRRSPDSLPASTIALKTRWSPLFVNTAPYEFDTAPIAEPVSVATSTSSAGGSTASRKAGFGALPDAKASVSARTMRPSASVCTTSIVVPQTAVTTSSGRDDSGPSRLSVTANQASTGRFARCGAVGARRVKATNAPRTDAAPAMSRFMPRMPAAPLTLTPPVSNVTPLPTSTTGRSVAPAGLNVKRTIAQSLRGEACATDTNAPAPASCRASKSSSSYVAPQSSATARKAPRSAPGERKFGGKCASRRQSCDAIAVSSDLFIFAWQVPSPTNVTTSGAFAAAGLANDGSTSAFAYAAATNASRNASFAS